MHPNKQKQRKEEGEREGEREIAEAINKGDRWKIQPAWSLHFTVT